MIDARSPCSLAGMPSEVADARGRASERAFLSVSALLFAGSTALTVVWCASMSAMGMPMPGGWTMSMAWMRMPGQTWPGAAASFLAMWIVMMVAMMLPSLIPMLRQYREAVGTTAAARAAASGAEAARGRADTRLGLLTVLVGAGYFIVWAVFGIAVFALGVTLAEIEMQEPALARAVPIAGGVIVLLGGAFQFSDSKAHHLACCRELRASAHADDGAGSGEASPMSVTAAEAVRHGLRLRLHCSCCCAGPVAILLAIGVMDLRAMAVVTTAISLERLAPAGEPIARATGAVAFGAGLFMIARATGVT
jgi:predicted metal-binding membrane protein